ncbi:MAG: radical SAM protein [Candidatus Hydrothermarchaeota archaeon]
MNVARKKILLQSKGVRIDFDLENKLKKRFSGVTQDFMSFFMDEIPVGILNGYFTEESPFEIRQIGNEQFVFKSDELFAKIRFLPRPDFLNKRTSEGIKMEDLCNYVAPGFLIIYLSQRCVYWRVKKQCKFCVTEYEDKLAEKNKEQIVELVEQALKEGSIKTHVNLTTGTLKGPDRGIKPLAEVTNAIKERFDVKVSVNGEPPRDLKYLDLLENADSLYINIEIFDEKYRKELMPGKGMIPIEHYVEVFKKSLEIFDENQVCSTLLAGLQRDEKLLEGAEFLAQLGVLPVVLPFYPRPFTPLENLKPPDAERMEKIYAETSEIIKDYGLDPFKTKAGFMRGGAIFALKEVYESLC